MFGESRKQPVGLGDLLLWYGLVDDGVLLQHDGSLLAAWSFRGPDLQSATHSEMNAIATRLASILRLGGGWMVQVDSFRTMANDYGPKGAFPDRVTALIDEERRVQFQSEGSHFESEYFLALTYLPPVAASERLRGFMISGSDKRDGSNVGADALRYFTTKIRQFEDVFSSQFPVKRLRAVRTQQPGGFERVDDELLTGVTQTALLVIKPIEAGLDTDLVVPTDRRTYVVRLVSDATRYISAVAFRYPDADPAKWSAFQAQQDAAARSAQAAESRKDKSSPDSETAMAPNVLDHLYFDYELDGDHDMRPVRVLDDGLHTYIFYPNDGRFREVPTLMIDVNGKTELVNFRVDGNRYVVDRLFDKGVLLLGVGKKQKKVTITRAQDYASSANPGGRG